MSGEELSASVRKDHARSDFERLLTEETALADELTVADLKLRDAKERLSNKTLQRTEAEARYRALILIASGVRDEGIFPREDD
jgi:hypothetical protein